MITGENDTIQMWLSTRGDDVRRKVRLLMLLDAADYAAITPIPTAQLHGLAYLADVLSPVYGLGSTRGKILKRRVGPYYPDLQLEIDRLTGLGLVEVAELVASAEEGSEFIDARFSLDRTRAEPILTGVYEASEFHELRDFFRSIAEALGTVDEGELEEATQADLTWEGGATGALIDFAEWRARNLSVPGANEIKFKAEAALGIEKNSLTPACSLHLYVKYLKRAANG